VTASAIELLVLDGQGVVFTDPLAAFLDGLADETGQSQASVRTRWTNEVREQAWLGTRDDEAIWRALTRGVGDRWGVRLEEAYGPGPAAARLPAWAARVPIWLLTNHRTAWIDRRLDRLGLRRYLSRILVSDALKALKPDPVVFAPILAHVRDPATVLVVDDQVKNVAAAAALGLCSLLADPAGDWVSEVDRWLGA